MKAYLEIPVEEIEKIAPKKCSDQELAEGKLLVEFEIRYKINPRAINPQRNHSVSLPFKLEVYLAMFPDAKKIPLKKKVELKYHNLSNIYTYTCNVTELESVFGKDWFFTHLDQSVGVFVGDITFTLKEKLVSQYQTKLEEGTYSTIMPETISLLGQRYLYISFSFAKYPRLEPGLPVRKETNYWKKYGTALAKKKGKKQKITLRYANKKDD